MALDSDGGIRPEDLANGGSGGVCCQRVCGRINSCTEHRASRARRPLTRSLSATHAPRCSARFRSLSLGRHPVTRRGSWQSASPTCPWGAIERALRLSRRVRSAIVLSEVNVFLAVRYVRCSFPTGGPAPGWARGGHGKPRTGRNGLRRRSGADLKKCR